MTAIPVLCQQCGSPLEIPDESVRFITCGHCATPLEIVRMQSQTHSRIMQEIHSATTTSAQTLKVIEVQNDLERLDRDWERYLEAKKANDPDGSGDFGAHEFGSLLLGAAGLAGIFMIGFGFEKWSISGLKWPFAGILLLAMAVWAYRFVPRRKPSHHELTQIRYNSLRSNLLQRLNEAKKGQQA
jgi:hypothetical protein